MHAAMADFATFALKGRCACHQFISMAKTASWTRMENAYRQACSGIEYKCNID